jgi:hypothetical protein
VHTPKEAQVDRSSSHAATSSRAQDDLFDALTRSLSISLPRRGVLGLAAAAFVTGDAGVLAVPDSAARRRKHKRGKRQSGQHGVAVSQRAASIPPNCIYVCCDGTCDSWKMCMKCVKWPKPTTTGGVLTQG